MWVQRIPQGNSDNNSLMVPSGLKTKVRARVRARASKKKDGVTSVDNIDQSDISIDPDNNVETPNNNQNEDEEGVEKLDRLESINEENIDEVDKDKRKRTNAVNKQISKE